jgi:hypothetical protein
MPNKQYIKKDLLEAYDHEELQNLYYDIKINRLSEYNHLLSAYGVTRNELLLIVRDLAV